MLVVGAPVQHSGRLYNAAVVIAKGRVLGVVPKSFPPNYREYYELRWFAPADLPSEMAFPGQEGVLADWLRRQQHA